MTQNKLRVGIGNHSLILLQTTEYYKRARDEPIPELPSKSGDPMTSRLLLNSTKPKDYARNAREEMRGEWCVCVCVLISTPPIFIAGCHRVRPLQPT